MLAQFGTALGAASSTLMACLDYFTVVAAIGPLGAVAMWLQRLMK